MSVTVDYSQFSRIVQEIAKRAGVSAEAVLMSEAEAILGKALSGTKAANAGKIDAIHNAKKQGKTTKGTPAWIEMDGKKYNLSHRYPTAVWQKLMAENEKNRREKKARRGLSKQSWLTIARQLGLTIKAAATYVSEARANGRAVTGATAGRKIKSGASVTLEGMNAMQSALSFPAGGRVAIDRAIRGRISFFRNNLKKGVFDSVEGIRRAYGGLTLR